MVPFQKLNLSFKSTLFIKQFESSVWKLDELKSLIMEIELNNLQFKHCRVYEIFYLNVTCGYIIAKY